MLWSRLNFSGRQQRAQCAFQTFIIQSSPGPKGFVLIIHSKSFYCFLPLHKNKKEKKQNKTEVWCGKKICVERSVATNFAAAHHATISSTPSLQNPPLLAPDLSTTCSQTCSRKICGCGSVVCGSFEWFFFGLFSSGGKWWRRRSWVRGRNWSQPSCWSSSRNMSRQTLARSCRRKWGSSTRSTSRPRFWLFPLPACKKREFFFVRFCGRKRHWVHRFVACCVNGFELLGSYSTFTTFINLDWSRSYCEELGAGLFSCVRERLISSHAWLFKRVFWEESCLFW